MFLLPLFAAIPVGLIMPNTGRAIGGAILVSVFFALFIVAFLIAPVVFSQSANIGYYFMNALIVTSVYIIFVSLSSLLGSIAGVLLREFF